MDAIKLPRAVVRKGDYGERTNAQRLAAYQNRKQYRAKQPEAYFLLPIFKPED